MKLWALTGGVGMGKSASAEFFAHHGAVILDTDIIARQVVEPGQDALVEIRQVFGSQSLRPDGQLDRQFLANAVFKSDAKRKILEGILHPRIRTHWKSKVESLKKDGARFVLVVIPLLYETGGEKEFQRVVCTACTTASQRQRLIARGWNEDQIKNRIAAQHPVSAKLSKADYVIWSEGSVEVHAEQVREIASRQ